MSFILEDFSTTSLAAAIKSNLLAWYQYLGRSSRADFYESPEMSWVLTGLTHSFLNAVLWTQLNPANADQRIAETLAAFRSKNVHQLSWYTGLVTQPADMGELLVAHGLTYSEGAPGMAVDLSALKEDLVRPAGLTIQAVADMPALDNWAHTGFTPLGGLETEQEACGRLFASLGFELPLRNYVGRLNGKLVATSQLFIGAGVAGIYWVATVPEARGQGIGAAMTLAPLYDARALGYRIAILQATQMGEGVYRRLGFQEYCRINHYVFAGEKSGA